MKETRHFFKVPFEITTTAEFKAMRPTSQCLYVTLCRLATNYGDKEVGWFYRSLKTLAEDCGLNRKTIIEAKKELIKANFIDVSRSAYENGRGRSSDSYKINGFRFRLKAG